MIIHLDLDCFFVSAERTRIPFLKGKPVVVCKSGDTKIFSREDTQSVMTESVGGFNGLFQHKKEFSGFDTHAWKKEFVDASGRVHGIVIAKSYEAKRYGIKTGTPLKEALMMCPSLLVVSSDHLFYQLLSTQLKAFLQTKIPVLEQYSIDEFWGDLKGWVKDEETYAFIRGLQEEILKRFDLPISIGASSSKWIAKLATDFNKPFGLTIVPKEHILSFVSPQPIESFPGIGKALAQKLHGYRIQTLGELIAFRGLVSSWGKVSKELCEKVSGEDNDAVVPSRERSSIGISRNFAPILERAEVKRRIVILSRHLSHTMMKLGLSPTTYYFQLRYDNGVKASISVTKERLFSEAFYRELALHTFDKIDTSPNYRVQHLTMHASNFKSKQTKTLSLLHVEEDTKAKCLGEKVMHLRDKYGVDIIRLAVEKR